MSISEKTFKEYFPGLRLHSLIKIASRWFDQYKDARINRLLLLSYRPPHEVPLRRTIKAEPIQMPSYAIAFEFESLPEIDHKDHIEVLKVPDPEVREALEEFVDIELARWQSGNIPKDVYRKGMDDFSIYLQKKIEDVFGYIPKTGHVNWQGSSVSIKTDSNIDDDAAITILLNSDKKPRFFYKNLDQYTDIIKARNRLLSDLQPEPGDTPSDLFKYKFLSSSDAKRIYKKDVADDFRSDWTLISLTVGESMPTSVDTSIPSIVLYPSYIGDPDSGSTQQKIKYSRIFQLKGDYWDVNFDGETANIKNLPRIQYIVHLIENPNRDFQPENLVRLASGEKPSTNSHYSKMSAQELEESEGLPLTTDLPLEELSPDDKREVEDRVNKVWEEWKKTKTDKAREDWDNCKNALLQTYKVKCIERHHELVFKIDSTATRQSENARTNAYKNINNAISDFKRSMPKLHDHLDSQIKTGKRIRYILDGSAESWIVKR